MAFPGGSSHTVARTWSFPKACCQLFEMAGIAARFDQLRIADDGFLQIPRQHALGAFQPVKRHDPLNRVAKDTHHLRGRNDLGQTLPRPEIGTLASRDGNEYRRSESLWLGWEAGRVGPVCRAANSSRFAGAQSDRTMEGIEGDRARRAPGPAPQGSASGRSPAFRVNTLLVQTKEVAPR